MNVEVNPSARFGSESITANKHFLARTAPPWAALGLLAALAFVAQPTRGAVTEEWVHRYNGPTNGDDSPRALALDASGNIVVTGYSYSGTNYDYYTAKYAAANGALLWEIRYNGPANKDDYAVALAVDAGGNVVVTGYSLNGTNADYYTAKYAAADGAFLWEKRYNGPANGDDFARRVAVDGSGNVVVTGYSYNQTNLDYYTAKYAAADGALLWEQRYNGPANKDDYAVAVAVDGNDNVVVTGYSSNGTNFDYYTAKYAAANGALLWEQRYNGPANGNDIAVAVAVDGVGNVVVTGYSWDGAKNVYYTAKYAREDGALLWEQRDTGPANSDGYAVAVAVDGGGNVVVTGYSYDTSGNLDYYTTKHSAANGALFWEQRYHGPPNGVSICLAVVVDARDNVYVTGYSYGPNAGPDYATVRYDPDGNQIWAARYNGANLTSPNNYAYAMAVDAAGNVYVTGASGGDFATIKYVQSDLSGFPTITTEPQRWIGFAGSNVAFSVMAGPEMSGLKYQWRFNGLNIAGATNDTLVVTNVQIAQAGGYSVQVSNSVGFMISSLARLTIAETPSIATAPQSVNGVIGGDAAFSVVAAGTAPLSYQWTFNGHDISGATNSTLFLTRLQSAQAGSYLVKISNLFGSVTSAVAQLTVVPASTLSYWISRDSGIAADLFGITYGNGLFVAVGYAGTILASADGVAWTNEISGFSGDLHGVGYGNGTFVAVGRSGTILTSLDGAHWTNRASGTFEYLAGVSYGNGIYVTVGSDPSIPISANGAA